MEFEIIKNCSIDLLPEPIKSAVLKNIKEHSNGFTDGNGNFTINSFDWESSNERVLSEDDGIEAHYFWLDVHKGGIINIEQKYLDFWNYKEPSKIEVNNIKPGVYTAKSKNKIYEITIKEILNEDKDKPCV